MKPLTTREVNELKVLTEDYGPGILTTDAVKRLFATIEAQRDALGDLIVATKEHLPTGLVALVTAGLSAQIENP